MEKLNSQQLIEVAKQLKVISRAINNFQIENWESIETTQFNNLNRAERDILLIVQDLIAQSVVVLADDSSKLIDEITQITGRINDTLKSINNINKAIEITTASVFFVSAIISQNPAAITLALQGIVSTLEE